MLYFFYAGQNYDAHHLQLLLMQYNKQSSDNILLFLENSHKKVICCLYE